MDNSDDQSTEHHAIETKSLFKHLLLFLVVQLVLRAWNMVMFPSIPWSGVILIIWTVILALHLVLFFLSTGVLGKEYENVPVNTIANKLFVLVKERNASFKQSFAKKKESITNNPTP